MSGMSRSSVSVLPNTGSISYTDIVRATTTTIAGPTAGSGEVWKVISVSIQPADFPDTLTGYFGLLDSSGNSIPITVSADYAGMDLVPVIIDAYVAGDFLIDENLRLEFTETADIDGGAVYVAYMIVN